MSISSQKLQRLKRDLEILEFTDIKLLLYISHHICIINDFQGFLGIRGCVGEGIGKSDGGKPRER
jgi:hypothetical protein